MNPSGQLAGQGINWTMTDIHHSHLKNHLTLYNLWNVVSSMGCLKGLLSIAVNFCVAVVQLAIVWYCCVVSFAIPAADTLTGAVWTWSWCHIS